MATTRQTGEPYELAGARMAFTNWYFVRPGRFGWYDDTGAATGLQASVAPDAASFQPSDRPRGIRLRAHQAVVADTPMLQPELPYEAMLLITSLIQDGGTFKGWGSCVTHERQKLSAYFESQDGRTWYRPELGLVEYAGTRTNNFTKGLYGAVFIDPAAPPEERYKAVAEEYFAPDKYEAYRKRRPNDVDPRAFRLDLGDRGTIAGIRGSVSPDGLRWTAIEEPLAVMHADSPMACYYDVKLQKYVGYFRDWMVGERAEDASLGDPLSRPRYNAWFAVGRRSIGRAETDDFRNFPLSEMMLDPRLDMSPSQVLYTNCKTSFPGAPDQHLLFPSIWDMGSDTTTLDIAASHDGKVWNWVPGAPLLETATFGAWNGGCVFAYPNLVELSDGTFALPYTGYLVPHKYPRGQNRYATGYAEWPRGRLIALEAVEYGEFATVAVIPPGQRLLLNAVTRRAGYVRVEAARLDGTPIEGRTFADSVPLVGDCYRTPVVWRNQDTLGVADGEPVMLRFRMEMASLYFAEFE